MEKIRVAFLGPAGTFSHQAASDIFPTDYIPQTKESFEEIFLSLLNNASDCIIVPIENTIEGIVTPVADLLIKFGHDYEICITKSYVLEIKQALLAPWPSETKKIKKIFSHPQALNQCRIFIERMRVYNNNLNLEEVATKSTAEAARIVSETNNLDYCAIGTRVAAKIYNLKILKENIADSKNNQTRFFVLSKKADNDNPTAKNAKTFIIFPVEDKPGALKRILEIFAVLEINMNSINSRPAKTNFGQYFFLVEINGHKETSNVKIALEQVKRRAKSLKILGSY